MIRGGSLTRPRSASPATTFYVDESGNSGDLVNAGRSFDFGQQPVFTLAGIGVDNDSSLAAELERLRVQHRVRSREIKSSAVKDKPAFVVDLVAHLQQRGYPIFLEVVDKRFFICATMVNHFVIPPVADEFDRRRDVIQMKSDVVDYLHTVMPTSVMHTYIDACAEPTMASTRRAFEALSHWLESRIPSDENARFVHQFAIDSFADFEEGAKASQPNAQAFLPAPDLSKGAKPYWMLPNLSSFTNLYARINLFRGREMSGVRIIHDEQLQYDHILHQGKQASESFSDLGLTWPLQHADYRFMERGELTFSASNLSAGIQAADVLAGFVMRYVQSIIAQATRPPPEEIKAFGLLLLLAEPERGTGLNFVLGRRDFDRLGLLQA
jgi:hypothetical protein